jgi:Fe-S cluster assembly ATP-binding protein
MGWQPDCTLSNERDFTNVPSWLLELRDLSLRLGGEEILAGIDLEIAPGEFHALLGANGAGKSSLAYSIMGCNGYQPWRGQLLFEGRDIKHLPIHERARLGITLAWQEPARFEGISIRDYLCVSGCSDAAVYLAQAGLDPARYLTRPLDRTLSGGERKRVELAAVAAMRPKLAILDEPAAGIDLLSLDDIVRVIEKMNRTGAAVLLITHQDSVAMHAQRGSQLQGGRIVRTGPAGAVIESYKSQRSAYAEYGSCS